MGAGERRWAGTLLPALFNGRAERNEIGTSFIELIMGVGVLTVLLGMAIPRFGASVQRMQEAAAARYVAGRIMFARSQAVMGGASVGLAFVPGDEGYRVRTYVDGDGDGVRTDDIESGQDRFIGQEWRLAEAYPSVRFELHAGVPPIGSPRAPGEHEAALRIGRGRMLSFSPLGTASSGTVYLYGERSKASFAVRILGATGRVRVLRFDPVSRRWSDQ